MAASRSPCAWRTADSFSPSACRMALRLLPSAVRIAARRVRSACIRFSIACWMSRGGMISLSSHPRHPDTPLLRDLVEDRAELGVDLVSRDEGLIQGQVSDDVA